MLWIASSGLADAALDVCSPSERERERAATIAKPLRRRQFIAGRMLLRRMLAELLGGRTEDFELDATAGAAPRLRSHSDLHLSVSHSGEWVAAAIADRPVGVDIEGISARRDSRRFARWVCSPDEFAAWQALHGVDADDVLIAHWTRKEAWLKREGGEVLLTRMHRLHAAVADASQADGATWRLGDHSYLSVCAAEVREMDARWSVSARLDGCWRMTSLE